ncbi:lysine transporter LysE [Paracidovorax avenae]|nr:lysine transporter LysE [Paracidovorax avenae]
MPDLHHLLLFIAAGWLLNLTPGPDVFYIVTHALRSGARAGIMAGLGITAGCFVHVAAAALGVGALLATSATAFSVLKWAGAAYLVWMGLRMLRARPGGGLAAVARSAGPAGEGIAAGNAAAGTPLRKVFLGGFWTNVLNPKVAIFFLAFVPQFIAPGAEHKALAFVLLGTLFNLNAIPLNAGWALAAAWMARRATLVQRRMHWLDRAAGAMFVGFGIKLALSERPGP